MGRKNFILVGSPAEKLTVLSAADWVGPYCGDWEMLDSSASPLFGHWNIEAETTGDYEISLYLFPPESNTALNRSSRNVTARPVVSEHLLVDDKEYLIQTSQEATNARFEVPLKLGERHRIEGQFLDAAAQPLWGAVYLLVQPLPR